VSHHTRVLRDLGCIELVRTEPRRGAVEHYYRPVLRPFLDDEQWEQLSLVKRRGTLHFAVADDAAPPPPAPRAASDEIVLRAASDLC
jgi:hypothetical protein